MFGYSNKEELWGICDDKPDDPLSLMLQWWHKLLLLIRASELPEQRASSSARLPQRDLTHVSTGSVPVEVMGSGKGAR